MPKTGKPSITPEVQKQIADCFFDGLTDEETASLCEINQKTIQRARRGDWCPAIKRAEHGRLQMYVRRLRDGAQQDWQRIAWFLERRYPERFSKPEIQLAINTTNQTVNNTLVVVAEVAKEIHGRVKEADAKIERLLKDKRGHNGNGNSHPEAKK